MRESLFFRARLRRTRKKRKRKRFSFGVRVRERMEDRTSSGLRFLTGRKSLLGGVHAPACGRKAKGRRPLRASPGNVSRVRAQIKSICIERMEAEAIFLRRKGSGTDGGQDFIRAALPDRQKIAPRRGTRPRLRKKGEGAAAPSRIPGECKPGACANQIYLY